MRNAVLALLIPVALSVGCATPTSATPPRISLKVTIDLGAGLREQWTLGCNPTAGTHPNRAAACRALAKSGRSLFAPVPQDVACTMIYGGPEQATVTGTWRNTKVLAKFNRTNGCEIARWEKAKALLTIPGTGVIRGAVSLGPTCPVQQQGQDCTKPSVEATVTAIRADGRTVTTRAVADRGFALRLPYGTWTLTADAGMRCPPVVVTVPGSTAVGGLTIACDTGIR